MKRRVTAATCLVLLMLGGGAIAEQKQTKEGSRGHGHAADHGATAVVACTTPVSVTEAAERKPGGALYTGPLPKEATETGKRPLGAVRVASGKHSRSAKQMKEMEGAHQSHAGQRGGELIMVPNQLHHLEVVYSAECGYQLFFYNAFTEPIRADRFQAFILVLPEDGDAMFEALRFLTPSAHGSYLASPIFARHDHDRTKAAFETELYIKFPESLEPLRFDVIVGNEVHWK